MSVRVLEDASVRKAGIVNSVSKQKCAAGLSLLIQSQKARRPLQSFAKKIKLLQTQPQLVLPSISHFTSFIWYPSTTQPNMTCVGDEIGYNAGSESMTTRGANCRALRSLVRWSGAIVLLLRASHVEAVP